MKRTVFLALALFALMAVGVYAQTGTPGLAFTAINNDKEYSVAKGTVTSGEVVIPSSYNKLPVTEITLNAFNGTQITAVTIPNSVKTIGGNAFLDCKVLAKVTIGKGVTSIGAGAFARTGITAVTIPDSVTSIGNNAFLDCAGLKSVTIWVDSSTLVSIGDGAFARTGITSLNIPDSVTSIGNNAFLDCAKLIRLSFYDSSTLASIGDGAFARTGIELLYIPASVKTLGSNAFMLCQNLTTVIFEGSIPSSGFAANAFGGIGDIRDKYLAGGAEAYIREKGGTTWTIKPY